MYGGMILFILSGACVLLSKKFKAGYTGYFGMRNYAECYLEIEEVMLKMYQKYPQEFLIANDGSVSKQIELAKENVVKLKKIFKR